MTRPIGNEMTVSATSATRNPIATALVVGFALLAQVDPAMAQSAEGFWLTDEGPRQAKVEIKKCGSGLCSKIVWLKQPNDSKGKPHRDVLNKDDSLRGRPVLGMPILTNLQKSGDRSWQGNVYNPEDGNTYKAHFTLIGKDRAQLKGCAMFGMACREKFWTRTEAEKPKIAKPKEQPKPVEPGPEALPEQNEAAVNPPAPPPPAPAPAQSEEVPAELWMDPAAVEPQPQPQGQPPAEAPQLKSSIDPAVPNAPTLDVPAEPQLPQQDAAIEQPAPAPVSPPQMMQPQAVAPPDAAPAPEQSPEAQPAPAAKPNVVKAKPVRKRQRQARPKKKETLPWLVQ